MKGLNVDSSEQAGPSKRPRLQSPKSALSNGHSGSDSNANGAGETHQNSSDDDSFVVQSRLPLEATTYDAYQKCFLLYRTLSAFHKNQPAFLSRNLCKRFFKVFQTQIAFNSIADEEVQDIRYVSGEDGFNVIYNFKNFEQLIGDKFICPFCDQNCQIYIFLKIHLETFHGRFMFQFSEDRVNCTITVNVLLNDKFEARYEPNITYLLVERNNSNYKKYMRNVLVAKPKKASPSTVVMVSCKLFSKFSTSKDPGRKVKRQTAPIVFADNLPGNQVFYHSRTLMPVTTHELDESDSEDEDFPTWLKTERDAFLDDFTDVNLGEKAFMKMWNSHMFKYSTCFIGRKMVGTACDKFVEEKGGDIVSQNLKLNFLMHLCILCKKGCIERSLITTLMKRIHALDDINANFQLCQGVKTRVLGSSAPTQTSFSKLIQRISRKK